MQKILTLGTLVLSICAPITVHAQTESAAPQAETMRLYRLDCGTIDVSDLNIFSDTDRYVGQTKTLTDSCYLIQKNDIYMLWDTGLPSGIVQNKEGVTNPPFHLTLNKTITEQLAEINLTPNDIDYVGISHAHFDHAGNVNLFTNAKLLIQRKEYDFLINHKEEAATYHMDAQNFSYFIEGTGKNNVIPVDMDTDIFKDGSVKAIVSPGHTPGHMSLLIKMPKWGPILLSGDQWHFIENYEEEGVPSFNYNRADTLASAAKIKELVKNTGAKLIIQHEAQHIDVLPKFPEYAE